MQIKCSWTGRHDDNVEVVGATSREAAKAAAEEFFKSESEESLEEMGFMLDNGHHSTWSYDEPQPEDWQDSYIFTVYDREPLPREAYEY